MRLALPLLLIGVAVACADPTTAPTSAGMKISEYRVIGGPGTGNPPPPPLAANVVILTDGGGSSIEATGTFDVNASRDGGTVTVDPSTTGGVGGGGFGFAAAAVAVPDPSFQLVPGPNGGSVVGSGVLVFRFNNDYLTLDLSRNLRSGNSLISPTCTISPNICALIRFEGAVFSSPASGTSRLVSGYIRVSVPPAPPIGRGDG